MNKTCKACQRNLPISSFYAAPTNKDKLNTKCKECYCASYKEIGVKRYHENKHKPKYIATRLLATARERALKNGIPFSLSREDVVIPTRCPVLDVPLVVSKDKTQDFAPTLDRIIPSLGYVPGNVCVVSGRANRLKSNASPDEILALAKYIKRAISKGNS